MATTRRPIPEFTGTRAPAWSTRSAAQLHSFAPGDHVVMSFSVVRPLRQLRTGHAFLLRARLRLESEGNARRRLHALVEKRRPYLQRLLSTILVRHVRAHAGSAYAVKVRKDAPLELLGPLACSGQTGAGAVLNVMKPKARRQLRGVRCRRRGSVCADGGEDRGLRSDHCGGRATKRRLCLPANSAPRTRSITIPAATWSARFATSPNAVFAIRLETSALPAVFRARPSSR